MLNYQKHLARLHEIGFAVSIQRRHYKETVTLPSSRRVLRGRTLLARIDWGVTMDPVTSPLIHKDSGHQARARSGRGESPLTVTRVFAATCSLT